MLKIATWNVNGIRAREAQVLDWVERERPDVICLQELKINRSTGACSTLRIAGLSLLLARCSGHIPAWVWHIRCDAFADEPLFSHPAFDFETRIVTAQIGDLIFISVYVPNGGKDFPAKVEFLRQVEAFIGDAHARGQRVVLCGDINIARAERDVHPKERNPALIGAAPRGKRTT